MIKYATLKELCPEGQIEKNVSLKSLSTMRAGGKASFLVCPSGVRELKNLINFLKMTATPYFVLGNGSNVLMCDKKYRGVIVKLTLFNRIALHKNFIHAEAGVSLSSVITLAVKNSLAGLEEGTGIPATIGGAVKMNASAYGFETAKHLRGVHILREGKVIYLRKRDVKFGYRYSAFKEGDIILSADFKLYRQEQVQITARQKLVLEKRRGLPRLPSLGSIFKREDGVVVSRVLDELGMKGQRCGDAMVSELHAGVIVNLGKARCRDVENLIALIKTQCYQKRGIALHEEIIYLKKP